MLAGTAAFINAVSGANGDNPTNITAADIAGVIQTLLGNNAYTIMSMIEGQDRFGTGPVRNAFFALGHTDLSASLNSVSGFLHSSQYASQSNLLESEWGSVQNLRFLLSSIGSTSLNASNLGATVYNVFCCGMESIGVVEQSGYTAQFIYRPPMYSGPLAMNATVGYKFAQVPRLLNDAWLINLRCTI